MPSSSDVASVAPYVRDEIIVASEHAPLVAGLIGVDPVPEPNALLGLTRFRLAEPNENLRVIGGFLSAAMVTPADLDRFGAAPTDPVEGILRGVRAYCAATYRNWVPTVGKNRTLDHVTFGTGAISHGGGGAPTPVRGSGGGGVQPDGAISHGGGGAPRAARGSGLVPRAAGPGQGVRVGVVDTRLFPVPYLAGAWAGGWGEVFAADVIPVYRGGHGTFVSGLIMSQAPGAIVQLDHVLDDNSASAPAWEVAEAIVRAGRSGVEVLNLSLVGYTDDGHPPLVLSAAIDRLDPDVVVVAAAGNHGAVRGHRSEAGWPAALDDVVAVGALDRTGNRASFSPDVPWVDIYAPGDRVVSCFPKLVRGDAGRQMRFSSGFARWSGTSFAAAIVSGAIAAGTEPGRVTAREAWGEILRASSTTPIERPRRSRGGPALTMRRLSLR
jgi:membrane-anchored mycosin MYCP